MPATTEPYVGRPLPRVEDRRLQTGRGSYVDDLNRERQLHASIVRSDLAHGRIRGVDVEAAKRRQGVVAAFTAEQLPDVRIPVRLFPTENSERLQPALARDRVRYVGDPVAVVVAEDPYVAEDGAGDVVVEIEPLEPALDPLYAFEGGGVPLHAELASNLIDTRTAKKGRSVEAASNGRRRSSRSASSSTVTARSRWSRAGCWPSTSRRSPG